MAEADSHTEEIIFAQFDLQEIARHREGWGIFRDRRPEMYKVIMTSDGVVDK